MGFYEEKLLPKITATVDAEMELPYFKEMLAGTLPIETFKFQCCQDYNYLVEYARAWTLAMAKCFDYETMKVCYEFVKDTMEWEIPFLRKHWQEVLGIDPDTMDGTVMANIKRAYTSHEMARTFEGDLAEQITALLPCELVYWQMGTRLVSLCELPEDHIYRGWMSAYTEEKFVAGCQKLIRVIDKLAEKKTPRELARLEEIFAIGCNYEYLSWRDMYYKRETWPLEELFPAKFNTVEKFTI